MNPDVKPEEIDRLLADLTVLLDNEDLGKAFFEMFTNRTGLRLIDFENFDNNGFHVWSPN